MPGDAPHIPAQEQLIISRILTALRENARRWPRRAALVGEQGEVTFAELTDRVDAMAASIERCGGQVIGLAADNGCEWIIADLAALQNGSTLVPVPPWFSASQLSHLFEQSGMDMLLSDTRTRLSLPQAEDEESLEDAETGLLVQRRAPLGKPPVNTAKITFTSGSTGSPKGVCLSAATIDTVVDRLSGSIAALNIEKHLCVTPLAMLLENIAGVYVPLTLGATVCSPSLNELGLYGSSRLDTSAFLSMIEATRAESLILQPELLRALTASMRKRKRPFRSLKFVAVGGARVPEADIEDAIDLGIPAYQGYGLSECASVVALNAPGASRSGSVGLPLPGIDIEIGEDGEILVWGQSMQGYLSGARIDREPVATGDLGCIDDDGYLYVTGRRKNVFITSFGRNVSPEWPESELQRQPAIAQVCVFGEGQPINTAVICPTSPLCLRFEIEEAIHAANRELPDYARVSAWIQAEEPFSAANGLLTATGKPRREAVEGRYLRPGAASPITPVTRSTAVTPSLTLTQELS